MENLQGMSKDYLGPANRTWGLFLISVLGLFLEMVLIRWVSTEVRIFAYLQNTVLVVCFLGLGLGCFTCRQTVSLQKIFTPLYILVFLFVFPWTKIGLNNVSAMLSVLGDFVIWGQAISTNLSQTIFYSLVGLAFTYLLMVLLMDIFIPIGRLLGRLIDDHPKTIWAYSVNIGGSLIGTWLFVLLSAIFQPPYVWVLVLAGLLIFFLDPNNRLFRLNVAFLLGLIFLAWFANEEKDSMQVVWSPYQKLVLRESKPNTNEVGKYIVTVNNVGYQAMIDLSETTKRSDTEKYSHELIGLSQYDIPFLFHPEAKTCLIVGAGTGNDAAGALRHEVQNVTAVEIDPAIISFGKFYHPEKPYSSVNVEIVNDDARSYFAMCEKTFDIIIFGLLDSHTTTAMTNARLDHYVYTRESILRAKSLLAPKGILVLSFEAQKPYIADRMAHLLKEVFDQEPLTFRIPTSVFGWGGVFFISGDLNTAKQQIAQNPNLSSFIELMQKKYPVFLSYSTRIATDDWPYIYLRTPDIPLLYYFLGVLLFLLVIRYYYSLEAVGLIARWRRLHWHFFFLGAAFLLLEVQNISKASVVLGNTWEVNAVIVSGVLVMILGANLLAYKFPRFPLNITYVLLIASCIVLYFVDLSSFAFLPYTIKATFVGGITTLPILFSGIIFIHSFANIDGKSEALGANLIGALVGALLQSVTFMTGIKALLLVVAGFYLLSLLTRPRPLVSKTS